MPRLAESPNRQIDSIHGRAICEEIGYRLRQSCGIEAAENPRHRKLLDRLERMEAGAPASDDTPARRGTFAGELFRSFTPLRRRRG